LPPESTQYQKDQQSSSVLDFVTTGVASNGGLVMAERVDKFTVNGKTVSLDIVGVFEVGDDGKVKRRTETRTQLDGN
jgi:limonene-1,2-epoxide hydrolase